MRHETLGSQFFVLAGRAHAPSSRVITRAKPATSAWMQLGKRISFVRTFATGVPSVLCTYACLSRPHDAT